MYVCMYVFIPCSHSWDVPLGFWWSPKKDRKDLLTMDLSNLVQLLGDDFMMSIFIYGGFHKLGIPKINGLKWKIPPKLGWFGGTPISGNFHIYILYVDLKSGRPADIWGSPLILVLFFPHVFVGVLPCRLTMSWCQALGKPWWNPVVVCNVVPYRSLAPKGPWSSVHVRHVSPFWSCCQLQSWWWESGRNATELPGGCFSCIMFLVCHIFATTRPNDHPDLFFFKMGKA